MKLRKKVSIILLSLWCVMMLIAYLGSQLILSKSYLDLENQQADTSLQRVKEAIDQMNDAVSTMDASWSIWDDTYQFVIDKNKTYAKTNLNVNSFASSDVDIMLYYNAAGKAVAMMAVNPERTKEIPVPKDILDFLSPNGSLMYQQAEKNKLQGLVSTASGVLLLSAHPILTSTNTGPSHGTLILAKYLSDKAINKVKDVTKLNLAFFPLPESKLDASMQSVYGELANTKGNIIQRNDNTTMTAYSLLKDINGNPAIIIKAVMKRTLYLFGIKTIKYFNAVVFIYSLILIVLLWYLLQKLLVTRLEKLNAQIGNIDVSDHYFNNLVAGLDDEVSSVASLYYQATHDHLTGLANRNLLEQVFNNNLAKINLGNSKIALLFLDIDHFKRVNDSLGHEIGDLLLIEMAKQLNSCLRENDLAVRLGGDEFVVMLVGINIQQIKSIVDRIYKSLSKNVIIQDHELYLGSSMGISIYPEDGKDITTLIKNADIALYHAKESGRNHYQYYSEELNQAILDAYRKEVELQRALDNKELCLFYQPIFDVVTKRIISLEALIRWRHPQRGILTAGEIIPVAEKSGLIVPIGKWVLETACQQAKIWHEKGLTSAPVAVNISILQTKHTSIDKLVSSVLDETKLESHLLELELTETSYVEINELILKDLQSLKNKGVTLVVDDFGVGYSGLGYLRSLPVSKLKIDQSFIKEICTSPDDSAITLAIIALAHQLDLQVIAEGVETAEQLQFLKLNNVDAAQGNYFCTPLDVEDCEAMLNRSEIKETR